MDEDKRESVALAIDVTRVLLRCAPDLHKDFIKAASEYLKKGGLLSDEIDTLLSEKNA